MDRTGLAQVHERRLKGLEWLNGPIGEKVKKTLKISPHVRALSKFDETVDKLADAANIKLKHEYIKYDKTDASKGDKSNSGFSKEGVSHDEKDKDTPIGPHYDDATMRQAEKNIEKTGKYKKGKYKEVGRNCQSYTDVVAEECERLQNNE